MIPLSRIISILLPSRGAEDAFLNMLIGSCRYPDELGKNILLLLRIICITYALRMK